MIRTQSAVDTILPSPSSPPGMTTSKSSKSSSFQSLSSEDGSVMADVGHFEEIGLDDDSVTLRSTSEHNHRANLASKAPSRNLATGRSGPRNRPSFPNLHTNVYSSNPRSTSLSALTEPPAGPPRHKPPTSLSTTSLPYSRRQRSPSPNSLSLSPKNPVVLSRPRRHSGHIVRERKSFTDLERECDEDDGDDIPDGMVLDNVPISPRPPTERSASRASSVTHSPERPPKERVRSVGNGTPAVAQAQGSLRSPTWKAEGAPRSPLKTRAHSWNSALAELNAEAKALTEKLEDYADEVEENHSKRGVRPNTWGSTRRSADITYERKDRVKSTPELPPLRRTNIMIDPLPISKEKEAVLSRTRPSWLPPKDPAEEKKHLKEYQKMMQASAKAEERREASRRAKTEGRDVEADNLMYIWENDVIPRWQDAVRERRTRELWWKGVAPRSRGVVWARAIGNELGLSESSFHAALSRAQELEARVDENKGDAEDLRKSKWFQQIRQDVCEQTWADLRIFQRDGPLHQSLVDVLSAYAMYRSDIGYVSGCNTIAALLLLNLPNSEAAFIALANILNRSLPLSFYASDPGAQSSACNLVLQTLSLKSSPLHRHLTKNVAGLVPEEFLHDVFVSMFTGHLAIDEAARLWDVYVFEGDGLLIRAAVAFLLSREMNLLATKTATEVLSVISEKNANVPSARPVGKMGAEDRFMTLVREAGKA